METFQHFQVAQKRKEIREAKEKSDSERRRFVTELHDDAQAKAYQDHIKDLEHRKAHGEDLMNYIKQRQEDKKNHEILDEDLLMIADNIADKYHQANVKENVRKHERSLRIGARQQRAQQHYKETILDKIVDKEDEIVAQYEAKEDGLYWNAVKNAKDRKDQYLSQVKDFQHDYHR